MVTEVTPNLRKLVIPDPGYIWLDCDLSKADAQVVAAEANEHELREIFAAGTDVYTERGQAIGIDYKASKMGVHAVDYMCRAKTLATQFRTTIKKAQEFIDSWYGDFPGIKDWHQRIEQQLIDHGYVTNKFGFRKFYHFPGDPSPILSEALAWIPQSTVAYVTSHGGTQIEDNLPEVELLLQVHDSLDMQVKIEDYERLKPLILKNMEVPIPYNPPLIIGVGLKASTVSWGDVG